MAKRFDRPPVLVLGGDEIALSVARSLAPLGIRVLALSVPRQIIQYSRHVQFIRLACMNTEFWARCAEFLTGPESDHLAGSVLLAAQDEALMLVTEHRDVLRQKFLLDRSNPQAQLLMLDKVGTYLAAREAGVPTPRFWIVKTGEDLRNIADELVYPLIVKPRHSHRFKARFGGVKHFVAHDLQGVEHAQGEAAAAGLETFLVERIPGPDSLLSSYYTYLDEAGQARFHFTKRIIRRYPKNMGPATYHITDHVPDIGEAALRLFRHAGLQGVANVEFKQDPRDGVHKLIECNARFTGANALVLESGVNIAELVWCEATGREPPAIGEYRKGVRMWYPWKDLKAYRELRSLGEIDLRGWIISVLHPQTFPIWSWRDPGPAVVPTLRRLRRRAGAVLRRLRPRRDVPKVFTPIRQVRAGGAHGNGAADDVS